MIFDKFKGLNNTFEPSKLPQGTLTLADNILIAKDKSVKRRLGYVQDAVGINVTGSYATTDNKTMFVIDSGSLYSFDGNGFRSLTNGFPNAPSFWCEESTNRVFVISNGKYIQIDNDVLVTDLHSLPIPIDDGVNDLGTNVEGPPTTNVLYSAYHQSSVVLAVRVGEELTRIQYSVPQVYHLFHKVNDRFEIPDTVVGMESVNGQLLIVCRHSVYVHTADSRLLKLADYGGIPGKPITKLPENGCFFWTTRGVIKYPEFENVSQSEVSLPPGTGAATALFEYDGDIYFLVCNDQAGQAYNAL